eukprot:g61517.t1
MLGLRRSRKMMFRVTSSNRSRTMMRDAARSWRNFTTSQMADLSGSLPSARHPAFEVLSVDMVEEYKAHCTLYQHKQSGAQILSAVSEDRNKVFGITFRTPTCNSSGLPHVLEHSVLCGSRNYPSKEPFVELLKGSHHTFLNAFTYPDRTCYPVASQNLQDFYNLIRVYLDGVLFPRAVHDPSVLAQEGWHYELEDIAEPLRYKGVVYNEMKGVYSSPDALLNRAAQQALFPDNVYAHDSGGDPAKIPSLTHKDLSAFHARFYHPSNARAFFWGDDCPEARLELLDEYFRDFKAQTVDHSQIEAQPKCFQSPKRLVQSFPAAHAQEALQHLPEHSEGQHFVTVNWLLNEEPLTPLESMGLVVLDQLLVGTETAVLRKRLTDSGLGSAVCGEGLCDELMQSTFSTGLRGVKAADVDKVEALVLEVLREVSERGFEEDELAAALNTVEFSLREFNTGSFPRGLSFMLVAMSDWIYGRPPTESLHFEPTLTKLKESLARKEGKTEELYLENLLKVYLLRNQHRVTVELRPDRSLAEIQQREEEQRLANVKAGMGQDELEALVKATRALKEQQMAPDSAEDLAKIPRLGRADMENSPPNIPSTLSPLPVGEMLLHNLPTSGIVYAEILLDCAGLRWSELPLLPLFVRMATSCGTRQYDEVALARRIGINTGGLRARTIATAPVPPEEKRRGDVVSHPRDLDYRFVMKGKATKGQASALFGLLGEVLLEGRLDHPKRCIEILRETVAMYEQSFRSNGTGYAATRLLARETLLNAVTEHTRGITHYLYTKEILKQAEEDWPALLSRLEHVRATLLQAPGLLVNLTGDEESLMASDNAVRSLSEALGSSSRKEPSAPITACKRFSGWFEGAGLQQERKVSGEGWVVPTSVKYVAHGGRLYESGEEVSGGVEVARRLLSLDYLWNTVRVQGGAYGTDLSLDHSSGLYLFTSYRDPNLANTLHAFQNAAEWLEAAAGLLEQAEIDKAVVATIGEMDSFLTPEQQGLVALRWHLEQISYEERQKYRNQVLQTGRGDLVALAARLRDKAATARTVAFASKSAIEDANATLPLTQRHSCAKASASEVLSILLVVYTTCFSYLRLLLFQ